MWMGCKCGPLGYDANERTARLNPASPETVRAGNPSSLSIRELGCVRRVKEEADRLGLRTNAALRLTARARAANPSFRASSLHTALETRFTVNPARSAQGSPHLRPVSRADRR